MLSCWFEVRKLQIKISWYLLRIWHKDDGNSKADQMSWSACTSLIATLRPTNRSFASLFAYIVTTCVGQRIGNSPGAKVLNPSPNLVVSSSIMIKFGVLI